MNKVRLDRQIYDKCNEAIVISGSARSGTTIFGKMVITKVLMVDFVMNF